MSEPVCVRVFNNRFEADRAKEILKSHGIDSVIWADDAGGMRPDLIMHTGGARLIVDSDVLDEAKSILDSLDEESTE